MLFPVAYPEAALWPPGGEESVSCIGRAWTFRRPAQAPRSTAGGAEICRWESHEKCHQKCHVSGHQGRLGECRHGTITTLEDIGSLTHKVELRRQYPRVVD